MPHPPGTRSQGGGGGGGALLPTSLCPDRPHRAATRWWWRCSFQVSSTLTSPPLDPAPTPGKLQPRPPWAPPPSPAHHLLFPESLADFQGLYCPFCAVPPAWGRSRYTCSGSCLLTWPPPGACLHTHTAPRSPSPPAASVHSALPGETGVFLPVLSTD